MEGSGRTMEKRLVIGILAHVDAGKTTLSEEILFETGVIRQPGRVTGRTHFWIIMSWSGPGELPFSRNRRFLSWEISR